MTGLEYLALAGVAGGACAQAITGLGFALVSGPVLIALLGPRDGVVVVCVLATVASVPPLVREWRATRWRDAARLLLPVVVATPLVAWWLGGASTRLLAAVAGAGTLLAVALLARGLRWARGDGAAGAVGAGVTSSVLNVVGGVGGPPIALFADNAGWSVPQTRSTLQVVFVPQNAVTVAAVGWATPPWPLLAATIGGLLLGSLIARRTPHELARRGVLVVAAAGGVALLAGWGS